MSELPYNFDPSYPPDPKDNSPSGDDICGCDHARSHHRGLGCAHPVRIGLGRTRQCGCYGFAPKCEAMQPTRKRPETTEAVSVKIGSLATLWKMSQMDAKEFAEAAQVELDKLGEIEHERNNLARWKREALQCLPDYQEIGRVLQMRTGTQVTPELILERITTMATALREIKELQPVESSPFPPGWKEQIAACEDCQSYKDHPIQQGICDLHRRPIFNRKKEEAMAWEAMPGRMRDIARKALAP